MGTESVKRLDPKDQRIADLEKQVLFLQEVNERLRYDIEQLKYTDVIRKRALQEMEKLVF